MQSFAASPRAITSMAVCVALAVMVLHAVAMPPWMVDDAFISFRFAENWASGHGPVFNPGERVEGYTSFLWIALLALGNSFGIDTLAFSKLLSGAFAAATVLLLAGAHRFGREMDAGVSATATLFLGTCGAFIPWAVSGMEVTLFTFLVLLALLLHVARRGDEPRARHSIALGLVLALAALTRPEGLLLAGLVLADGLLAAPPGARTAALLVPGVFLVVYIPYFAWRYAYYGFPLPNTFYVKVGSRFHQILRGLLYAARFAVVALPLGLVALFALISRRWFRRYRRLAILPLLFGVWSAYVLAVGGDFMPAYRFFTPVVPILCLVAALSLRLLDWTGRRLRWTIAVFVLWNLVQLRVDAKIHHGLQRETVAWEGREVGLWLRDHVSPDAFIATNTSGSVPYYSRLRTLDMLGLNDVHIAHRKIATMGAGTPGHEKGDGAYVLSLRPDYIQFGSSLGSEVPMFLSDYEIAATPGFTHLYSLDVHTLPSGKKLWLYARRPGL